MCGIFGYVGPKKNAGEIVLKGLKTLEYRGYDSWGIALSTNNKLLHEKHIGKIGNANGDFSISNFAIGHTRWATHGGVTVSNAHPHFSCDGKIAVTHNGIVENYQELKSTLKNHKFKSQTDTEVISHMIEEEQKNKPFFEAVKDVFRKLSGLNAVITINKDGEVVVARKGSPLVLGVGKNEYFLASDPTAILLYTKKVIYLEDNQAAHITLSGITLYDLTQNKKVSPKIEVLNWNVEEVGLGKFKHFMLKEIFEQPVVISNIAKNCKNEIEEIASTIKNAKGTFFIGCGTASYAALSGQYLFSTIAKHHVNFSIGSEFNYLEDYLNKESLVIAISQSGETIDVVEPTSKAKKKGAKVVAITNVLGSTLYRMADYKILLGAGPEIAVCATKSFIAMVSMLIYIAYQMADKQKEAEKLLLNAAESVRKMLDEKYLAKIKHLAKKIAKEQHLYLIGRGLSYPTALEATLKLKEVPYVHSEGFAGGELKHGVIALIENGTPVIVFAPNDETHDSIISNAIEIKARGGYIIGISPKPNEAFDYYLEVSDLKEATIIPNVVIAQLLSYYIALEKNLEPDKPRNLAKSVTVK